MFAKLHYLYRGAIRIKYILQDKSQINMYVIEEVYVVVCSSRKQYKDLYVYKAFHRKVKISDLNLN